jgi:hypothetical protein
MTKRNLLLSILTVATLVLTNCQAKNKYYYREGSKDEKLIEAYSDSAAYLEAFKNFEISKKVYSDMKKAYGDNYLSAPISFQLQNDKHEDITYKVSFANKDSLENSIAKTINNLPNNIEQRANKIREEKHGVGAKYDTSGLYLAP